MNNLQIPNKRKNTFDQREKASWNSSKLSTKSVSMPREEKTLVDQKIRISATTSNLLMAAKFDLGIINHQCNQQLTCNKCSTKYTSFDDFRTPFPFLIDVSSSTGRNDGKILQFKSTEERFRIRSNAFEFLNNYWNKFMNCRKISEFSLRSSSPLRYIFEAQEKDIFDIPQKINASPKVKIFLSNFNNEFKKNLTLEKCNGTHIDSDLGDSSSDKPIKKRRLVKSKGDYISL